MLISKEFEFIVKKDTKNSLKIKYNIPLNSKEFDKFIIPVNLLSDGSHQTVLASCDYCDFIFHIPYKEYKKRTKNVNKICCTNRECRNKKTIDVNLVKFGSKNPMYLQSTKNKLKENIVSKYGVSNVFQLEKVKEKSKNTCLNKYGVEYASQSEEFQNNVKKTSLEKYGVDNPFKSDKIKSKIKKTILDKYDVEHPMHSEEIRKKTLIANDPFYIKYLKNNKSLFKCDCGNEHTFEIDSDNYWHRNKSNTKLCTICLPIGDSKSLKEKELFEFICSNYAGSIISGYRDNLEIDIYLPDLKIGFEFNGLYYHSDKFKEKNYHIDKTNYFREKGIRIIHIWEDDWIFQQEILKSQIKNWLNMSEDKIYARKCEIVIVDSNSAKNFLNENHLQGNVNSKLKLGLYYNDKLVSLMTFDHNEGRKKMDDNEWNLSRFCNITGYNVIGGASKLLKYFIKNYNPKRIISYADKDWSTGELYEKIGFVNVQNTRPDYKYIINGKRSHKSKFRKSNLNTTLTESEYMKLNNVNKVYDCGKSKYEMIIL